jgi:hypothetical protein
METARIYATAVVTFLVSVIADTKLFLIELINDRGTINTEIKNFVPCFEINNAAYRNKFQIGVDLNAYFIS